MKIENLCINCMKEKPSPEAKCPHCGYKNNEEQMFMHRLEPFTILSGKYIVGRTIGEGGFGITYVGMDLNLEMRVAIKEYYPNGCVTRDINTNSQVHPYTGEWQTFFENGKRKFINEAKVLAKCSDIPQIVAVKDYFEENHTAYIVMEYVEGKTLKQYLSENGERLSVQKTLSMLEPVITALGRVHKMNLIHRDISPDNIMIGKDGNLKILDFGGARDFEAAGKKSMSIMLKPGYAPEEQYRSHGEQGPWTDVYSVCATIYHCITGEIPPEALERVHMDKLKPLSECSVSCPSEISKAIMKGLMIYKDGRFQSMEELHGALYQGVPVHFSEKRKRDDYSGQISGGAKELSGRKKPLIIGIAAAAIVLVGGIGVFTQLGHDTEETGTVASADQDNEKKVVKEKEVSKETEKTSEKIKEKEAKKDTKKTEEETEKAEEKETKTETKTETKKKATPTPKKKPKPTPTPAKTEKSVPEAAPEYVTYYVVNCKQSITLRPQPDVSSGEICQIPLGAAVSYVSSAENGFYKVTYNGNTGYALASYLSTEKQAAPSAEQYTAPSYETYYVVNCKQSITLRPQPDVSSGEICQIPLGAAVSYVSSAENGFYKVIYNGSTGYALASYLSREMQHASEPQYTSYEETYYVVNCNESITLRTSPSTSAGEICQIPLGAAVSYISAAENGFYYIYYNGNYGYSLASYLSPSYGEPAYKTCRVVNCNESITLRDYPDTSAGEICQIPLGAIVSVVSGAGNGFYEVYYMGQHGYALSSYLAFQ